jgi:hypothetical protein
MRLPDPCTFVNSRQAARHEQISRCSFGRQAAGSRGFLRRRTGLSLIISCKSSKNSGLVYKILTNVEKTPLMHWDRHALTAFGGIAALLVGWATLFADTAGSFVPDTAMIGGIAAIAMAGLERLKQRVGTLEKRPAPRRQRMGSKGGRGVGSVRRSAADRARPRPGVRRHQLLRPCRRALVAWSSPAGAEPRG